MTIKAISVIAVLYMLINGIAGLKGKTFTANMGAYTPESVAEMSRKIAIPYIIVGLLSAIPLILNILGHFSYAAYFINIGVLVVLLIYHISINKKILKKNGE